MRKANQKTRYWIVAGPHAAAVPFRHPTHGSAATEARRLAKKHPGQIFHVFGMQLAVVEWKSHLRFREHRGGLDESMATLVELPDRAALVAHCRNLLAPYGVQFAEDALLVENYNPRPDLRIGWSRTYIVVIRGFGVVGFCDHPVYED